MTCLCASLIFIDSLGHPVGPFFLETLSILSHYSWLLSSPLLFRCWISSLGSTYHFSPIFLLVVFLLFSGKFLQVHLPKFLLRFFFHCCYHVFNFKELFCCCSLNFFIAFIVQILLISLRILRQYF